MEIPPDCLRLIVLENEGRKMTEISEHHFDILDNAENEDGCGGHSCPDSQCQTRIELSKVDKLVVHSITHVMGEEPCGD